MATDPAAPPPSSSAARGFPHGGRPRSRAALILRDAHFWIPVAVLLAGLVVLRWIS